MTPTRWQARGPNAKTRNTKKQPQIKESSYAKPLDYNKAAETPWSTKTNNCHTGEHRKQLTCAIPVSSSGAVQCLDGFPPRASTPLGKKTKTKTGFQQSSSLPWTSVSFATEDPSL